MNDCQYRRETACQLAGIGRLPGGAARSDSARIALAAIGDPDCGVLLHDAARPLVDQRIIADCVAALEQWPAIGVVVPSTDTIVEIADGVIGQVLPRASLARCQTPQGFRLGVIARAHELAAADPGFRSATDDCGVVRRYLPQVPIGAVPGSEQNIKVTYPGDLELADLFLRQAAR